MRDSNQTYFVYKYYIFVYNGIADEAHSHQEKTKYMSSKKITI